MELSNSGNATDVRLVGVILTKNEEECIAAAIRSLHSLVDAVVVVDSESTDETRSIARALGAHVVVRAFDSFSRQRNFALDVAISTFSPEWVLSIDADEEVTPALRAEINELITRPDGADAYLIPLRILFDGRVLQHGGFQRTVLLRLFRANIGRYEDRDVNEHFVPTPSATIGRTQATLLHADVRSWTRHIEKHNRYSSLEAEARLCGTEGPSSLIALRNAIRHRHLRRRYLREQVWNRLPLHPVLRFLQIYWLSFGFLDGRAGFRVALFTAWHEMCIDCKYEELLAKRPVEIEAKGRRASA